MNQKQYSITDFGSGSLTPWDTQVYSGFFQSERRCPGCGLKLNTNGKGDFRCNKCGFKDHKDVSKLLDSDLGYTFHNPHKRLSLWRGK